MQGHKTSFGIKQWLCWEKRKPGSLFACSMRYWPSALSVIGTAFGWQNRTTTKWFIVEQCWVKCLGNALERSSLVSVSLIFFLDFDCDDSTAEIWWNLQPSGPGWLQPPLAVKIAFWGLQGLRRRAWQMGSHLGKWSLPFGFQWLIPGTLKLCGNFGAADLDEPLEVSQRQSKTTMSSRRGKIFAVTLRRRMEFFEHPIGGAGAWDRYCDGQWKRHGLSIDSYHQHRMILPTLRMAVRKLFAWALASSLCFYFPTFEAKRVSASIDCFIFAAASCCFESWILSAYAPWNHFQFQGAARDDWPS